MGVKNPKPTEATKPNVTAEHGAGSRTSAVTKVYSVHAKRKPPNAGRSKSSTKLADGAEIELVTSPFSKHEANRKRTRVKIGGVYVTGDKASAAQLAQAIARSSEMLERLARKIARPGVQIRNRRDIPLFSADPEHPGHFLRKLNGKIDRGVLEDGTFKVID